MSYVNCEKITVELKEVVRIDQKDYDKLSNKPKINGVTLQGNKSALELGLVPSDLSQLEAVEQPTKSVRQTVDMFVDNNGKPSKIALQQVKGMATKVVYANELGNVDFEKLDIDDYVILGDEIYRVVDAENNIKQLLPETSAEHVTFADKQGEYTSTNVEDALAEVMDIAKTGGVTGVKGDAETEYRKGNVSISKANIGLDQVDNTADVDKPISNAQAAAIQSIQDNVADIISGAQTVGKATQVKYPLNLSGNVSVQYDGSRERMIDFSRDSFHTNWNANSFDVELKNTGVTAGTYNGITVDVKGRVVSAENKNYASVQYVQEGLAGKSRSIAFANYQAFVTAVNGYGNTTLKVSDNVFVKTLGVPDMWVTAVNSEKATYTYTNDQAIVNALNTTNGLTVGYYTFSLLETEKIDLTSYQQKTDDGLNTTNKTVVGAINEVKGTADNAVQSFEAEATIDNTTGTPTVDVVKSGEGTAPTYTFNFKHLKGADGRQGEAGLVYNKLYSSTINPDIVGSQTITIPTSDFNRTPKTNETFILFNQHGYYLEATVSSITIENNIQVAKCLIVPSKAVNINGTNGIDGKDALVYTELFFGDISADDTWGLSLANFNRTPRVGERFIFFTTKNQYALMSVEKLYGDGMVAAGVYDHSSQYIVSTKGQDGVSVTNATAGTPVIDGEKTTTPITFSLSDGTTKEVQVEAQNGNDGAQGVGVKSITSGTPTVVNDKTNTPITITLTDNTTVDLVVSAENGKDGTSATVDIVQTTGQSITAVMSQKAVTNELNKKASTSEVNAKYTKPESGIPKSDLAEDVKTSLGKADTALQNVPSYNDLPNIPVINQDLSASGFTPVANTYYRHTGATTATFTQGVIYLYDTAYHKLGESGGGKTYQLVKKTVRCTVASDAPIDELRIGLPSAANKNILDVIKENNNCSLRLYLSDNVATYKYVDLQPHQHQNDSTKIWFDFTGGLDAYVK